MTMLGTNGGVAGGGQAGRERTAQDKLLCSEHMRAFLREKTRTGKGLRTQEVKSGVFGRIRLRCRHNGILKKLQLHRLASGDGKLLGRRCMWTVW